MLLAKIGTGLLATAIIAGGVLSSQGFVHVRVLEKQKNGTHLRLIVPALAVPAALKLVPGRQFEQAASHVRPWLPAIHRAASVLADCPDGTLVEVTEPSQRVNIAKSDGSIVVDVNDPSEHVYVSLPLVMLRSAANVLASRAEPQ